jgi:hypothetical protein
MPIGIAVTSRTTAAAKSRNDKNKSSAAKSRIVGGNNQKPAQRAPVQNVTVGTTSNNLRRNVVGVPQPSMFYRQQAGGMERSLNESRAPLPAIGTPRDGSSGGTTIEKEEVKKSAE